MSQDFVTKDELESLLYQFVKISAMEERFRQIDVTVRGYVDRTITQASAEIRNKSVTELGSVKNEVSQLVASQMTAVKEAITSDFTSKYASFTQEVRTDALKHSLDALEKRSNEIRGEFFSCDSKLKSEIEAKLVEHQAHLSESFCRGIEEAVFKASATSSAESKAILQSFQSQSQQSIENALKEITQTISKSMKSFQEVLTRELAEKVIDKQKIEARMESIQAEIHAKAQSVIEFQIEQARLMMEQSARAEVKDGIQSALSLLTR